MPTVPDAELVSSWEEVDEAAQSVKNGLQKEQLSSGVRASLGKADDAWARLYWISITRSGSSYACDKTLAEIQSAQLAGAFVRAHLPDGFEADITNVDGGAMFYSLDNSGGPMVLMRYTVAASGVSFDSWPIGGSGSGLTEEIKQALLACFDHVAWDNTDGQDYYDALQTALYSATLVSITADYQQDRPVYADDDLDVLKVSDDLTVTANYSDGSSVVLGDDAYELSGTLTAGTSTITVTYSGKTDTFTVTVTAPLYSIPDFAAQTVTLSNGTVTVSKTNDVYTLTSKSTSVVYIYPNGTASASKSNTAWFDIAANTTVANIVKEIDWSNPNSYGVTLGVKYGKSDATGNVLTTSFSMTANGSGTGATAEAEFTPPDNRHISCVALQLNRDSGSGAHTSEPSASFKFKLFVNGVRYL